MVDFGRAFLAVHADTGPLESEMKAGVRRGAASAEFKSAGTTAGKSFGSGFAGSVKSMVGTGLGLLGIVGVAEFAKTAISAGTALQKSTVLLTAAEKAHGQSVAANQPILQAASEAALRYGVSQTQVQTAVTKLINAGVDMKTSLQVSQAAMSMSAVTGRDYTATMNQMAMGGGTAARTLKQLGITQVTGATQTKALEAASKLLNDRIGAAGGIAGYAASQHLTLAQAQQIVSGALKGNIADYNRLNIEVLPKSFTMQQNLAEAAAILNAKYGVEGKAATETYAGVQKELAAVLEELAAHIGVMVLPALTAVSKWIVDQAIPAVQKFAKQYGPQFRQAWDIIGGALKVVGGALKTVVGWLGDAHLLGPLTAVVASLLALKKLGVLSLALRVTGADRLLGLLTGAGPGGAAEVAIEAGGMQRAADTMMLAAAAMQRAADTMLGAGAEGGILGGLKMPGRALPTVGATMPVSAAERVAMGAAGTGAATTAGRAGLLTMLRGGLATGGAALGMGGLAASIAIPANQMVSRFIGRQLGPGTTAAGWAQTGSTALAGAGIGAAAGSVVPVVGTAIGAGVGAAAGLVAGIFAHPAVKKSIAQMWSTAYEGFQRDVGGPVTGFFTRTLPSFFSRQVAARWSGIYESFMRDVGSPVAGFFTRTLPGLFASIGRSFSSWWAQNGPAITKIWRVAWEALGPILKAAWAIITGYFKTLWAAFLLVWNLGFNVIRAQWSMFWQILQGVAKVAWALISQAARVAWAALQAIFQIAAAIVTAAWRTFWATLGTILKLAWAVIQTACKLAWDIVVAIFTVAINLVTGRWGAAWHAIQNLGIQIWHAIYDFYRQALGAFTGWWDTVWTGTVNVFRSIWNGLASFFTTWWQATRQMVTGAVNGLAGVLSGAWNGIKNTALAIWGAIKNGIGAVWDGIKQIIKEPINWLSNNVWNKFAGIVNTFTNFVGLGKPIPTIPQFARGGKVPGYGGGDIIPFAVLGGGGAVLEPGELIMPKEAAGDPRQAALAREYGVPGYQWGGIVSAFKTVAGGITGGADWLLHTGSQLVGDLESLAKKLMVGALKITAKPLIDGLTSVLGHFPNSQTEWVKALINLPKKMFDSFLNWLGGQDQTAGGVANLPAILSYAEGFKNKVPYVWGGDTPSGWDCSGFVSYVLEHFKLLGNRMVASSLQSWAKSSGPVPGAMAFYGKPAHHVGFVVNNSTLLSALGAKYGTIESALSMGDNSGYGVPPGGLGGAASLGAATPSAAAAQEFARAMLSSYGWGGDQMNPLISLWNGESGWRWDATNPSSGAYGIPQALPASKMASAGADWRTNPATQIKWGLGYIKSVYGSPGNAYSTWLSRSPHWYGRGGPIPAGYARGSDGAAAGWGLVGEAGPELVRFLGGEEVIPLARGGAIPGYATGTSPAARAQEAALKAHAKAVAAALKAHEKALAAAQRAAQANARAMGNAGATIAAAYAKVTPSTSATTLANDQANYLKQIAYYYRGSAATQRENEVIAQTKQLGAIQAQLAAVNAGLTKAAGIQQQVLAGLGAYGGVTGLELGGATGAAGARAIAAGLGGQAATLNAFSAALKGLTGAKAPASLIAQVAAMAPETGTGYANLMTAALRKLAKAGAPAALVNQLVALGPDSANAYADALLAGGPAAMKQISAAEAQISAAKLAISRGTAAAETTGVYNTGASFVAGLQKQQATLDKMFAKLGKTMAEEAIKWFGVPSKQRPYGYQLGGLLAEPVAGFGLLTGAPYTFAEAGPEWVTPVHGGGSDATELLAAELRKLRQALEAVPARTAAGVAAAVRAPQATMAQAARIGAR